MNRPNRRMTIIAVAIAALVAAPLAVLASHEFSDVPDSNVHHDDIGWLAESGVTFGCNPPENTQFCPGEPVLRQQMASFLRRLAENRVVDAATAVTSQEADHATTADTATNADTATEASHAADSDTLAGEPPISYRTVVEAANCGVTNLELTPSPVLETSCLPGSDGQILDGTTVAVFDLELETETAGALQLSSTSLAQGMLAWSFTLNEACGSDALALYTRAVNGQAWGTMNPGFSTSGHTTTSLPAGTHTVRLCAYNITAGGDATLASSSLTLDWTAGGSVEVQSGDQPTSRIEVPDLLGN